MTKSNIWGHVCYTKSDQDIYLRHTLNPSTEQVGIIPTNTKQCMNVYLGELSLFSLTSFPIHFSYLEDLPAHLQLLDITRVKRQHIKGNQLQLI